MSAFALDASFLIDTPWAALSALARGRKQQAAPVDTTIATGEDAVVNTRSAWRDILRDGGAVTAFQTFDVARELVEPHLRRGDTPRVVTVYEAGRPVAVLPTVVTRWGGVSAIRFLGDPLIQYGDIITSRAASPAHIEAAWCAAADPAVANLAYFRRVRDDARISPLLMQRARTVGSHEAPFVDLGSALRDKPRDIRERRRYRRRLMEAGEVRFEVLQGQAAVGAVGEAMQIKREWLKARAMSSAIIGDGHWEAAIASLAADAGSPLRAARLSVGGNTAAIEIGLLHGSHWCAFIGAVSPAFAKAGPGHVQMEELIAHCRSVGLATYDLLAPADAYKKAISHGAVSVRDFALPLSPVGWAGMMLARSIPAIKVVTRHMPVDLRRAMTAIRSRTRA